jgi:CRP-like cAMP-binding protein
MIQTAVLPGGREPAGDNGRLAVSHHPSEVFIRKLRISALLDAADIQAIERLPILTRELPAQTAICREGERPAHCCLLIAGFACRSKTLDLGKRQILSIDIAGDIPNLESLHLDVMDHDLTTLGRCTVGLIAHESLRALTRERPSIAAALWRDTLIDAAMFREWIVNVGRRSAASRLAHLLTEIGKRLAALGLAERDHFELPMTQLDLADALGLSPVHVNRVLQELRHAGLLEMRKYVVTLRDLPGLTKLGDFDGRYLHQNEAV